MPVPVTYEDVLRSAQALPEIDNVRLVEELLSSMDLAITPQLDDLWVAEIHRRSDELDSGAVQTIAWSEVR